jgi:hypothetical protein
MGGLGYLFQDTSITARTGALLGILLHQVARSVEFELYMFHFMALFAASLLGLTYALAEFEENSILVAFTRTSLFACTFGIALLASVAVYRLFFHRCRNFPGPLSAKITRFYATYLSARELQYYKELEKVHIKYGDFVRTGRMPSKL